MAKAETKQNVKNSNVKNSEEYKALLGEYERVKKELAVERSRANIIDEAVQVASSTGELRYRGHYIPAIYYRNISHALGMVTAVRVMEILDTLRELPAEISRMVRDVLAERDETPKAEGTD